MPTALPPLSFRLVLVSNFLSSSNYKLQNRCEVVLLTLINNCFLLPVYVGILDSNSVTSFAFFNVEFII